MSSLHDEVRVCVRARTLVCARVRVVGRAVEFHAGGGCLDRQLYVQPPPLSRGKR